MYFFLKRIKNFALVINSLFLILPAFSVRAQSLIGLQSNYAGSHAVNMNPASLTTSNIFMDIGLFSFGAITYNDFMYVKSKDFRNFIFNSDHSWPEYYDNKGNKTYYLYNQNRNSKNLNEAIDLNLFSSMYNINGISAIGFSINNRVYSSARHIPWEIPMILTQSLDSSYYNHYSSTNSIVSNMEWSEIALSYSRTIYEHYQNKLDVGVNLKFLMGYAAAVFDMRNIDYEINNDIIILVNSFDADIAYSIPLNYNQAFANTAKLFNSDRMIKGWGGAADIGIVYTKKQDCIKPKKRRQSSLYPITKYYWRLGLSLLDLGSIKYKNNAELHHFETGIKTFFNLNAFDKPENFEKLAHLMSATYYNDDSLKSKISDKFVVGLPSAVSIQFDWNFAKNSYLNATVIQPINLFEYSVSRSASIMLAPRYESEYFEATIPVILNDYKHLLIGASVRYMFLTIGTENIASFLGIGKLNGLDIFISLKYNLEKDKGFFTRDTCYSNNIKTYKKRSKKSRPLKISKR